MRPGLGVDLNPGVWEAVFAGMATEAIGPTVDGHGLGVGTWKIAVAWLLAGGVAGPMKGGTDTPGTPVMSVFVVEDPP